MFLNFEARLSDSPFVERVWRSHSERGGPFVSIAAANFEMAVSRLAGRTFLTLRGPETKATTIVCPPGGEWLGIRFRLGTFMPRLPPEQLRDHNDVTLPDASSRSFWLDGSVWEYPDFDNAEDFVARLVREGIITREPAVDAVVRDEQPARSLRTAQRHFLRATGLTHRTVQQIERARHATNLLREGISILDTVHDAGYFDQAHLTRSLKHLIGQTPGEIGRGRTQLSFLYKTEPLP
jgi:AraC-like DNA-binding protein